MNINFESESTEDAVTSNYTQASPSGSFSISHGISESFISQGNQSLRKLNLLNIQYSEIENQRFSKRKPSTYTLRDLYNPQDLKENLKKLEQTHGKDKLTRAIKTASVVFEENNPKRSAGYVINTIRSMGEVSKKNLGL